jgi:uncharacterized Zn finger protein (UPF0148 family)
MAIIEIKCSSCGVVLGTVAPLFEGQSPPGGVYCPKCGDDRQRQRQQSKPLPATETNQ